MFLVSVAGFGIQRGFGGVGELAVETEAVGGTAVTVSTVEHCTDEGGFHGV